VTWTYDGAPGTSTADGRRDAVRVLAGDTDTNDQQVTDETITFYLSESGDDVYGAAAATARAIAASYGRRVNTAFEGVRADYDQLQQHYLKLATRLDREGKLKGAGLGVPRAGGISIDEMDSADENDDRPLPRFRRGQFSDPPDIDESDGNYRP